MRLITFILHLSITLIYVSTLSGQRFSCDGQLLIATYDGVSTRISRPVSIPFNPPFLSPFVKYTNQSFDALGFNAKDNYIYGVQQNSNVIVKLKKNSSFEIVGAVSIVDTLKSNAGDCTPEGLYLCHDYTLNQILVFDVVDGFELLNRVDLFWDTSSSNSGSFKTRIFDFAIDPKNPTVAYAYQGTFDHPSLAPPETRGFLLRINIDFDDPNLGMVTPVRAIDKNAVSHLGGLVFDSQSNLLAFGSSSSGVNPPQDRLYSINVSSSNTSQLLVNNYEATYSDGCSCPYSFSFTNQVPLTGIYCNNDLKKFTLTIENNAFVAVDNVILTDTFPDGMIIEEISSTFIGNISAGTGLGSNILEISGLKIPGKSKVKIELKVRTIDAKVGATYNQAFLRNLPARFEGDMGSDQLGSPEIGDPSLYSICGRELEDVSWEIILATNCIEANNGKIIFTSEQFFEGQGFEIGLRNKIGWEEMITQVVIDADNSFTVDSVSPGDYQLFSLRSLSENCSLVLEDTTILVEAPNDLIVLEAMTNSPICQGETLLLDGEVTPEGNIRWTGPRSFGSDLSNAIIENTETNITGEYKVVAKYGFCSQTQYIDVAVKPKISVSITGESAYCERDKLLLAAIGDGTLNYSWKGPNNLIGMDSILSKPNLNSAAEGYYQVISTNGGCYDTAGIDILVLPTPTLTLDEVIMTDFCTPVTLNPVITGDSDVSYQWFPFEGLDCSDCSNPQIQPLVQPTYLLRVENDFSCTDSAEVKIVLDKVKLVYAPNVFQLASTSGNNQFAILPGCIVHYVHTFNIVDRWGNTVFSTSAGSPIDVLGAWDGFIQGKQGSMGVYIWFAKVELVDGSIQYLTGDVTLLEE
ncbi:MAG: putative repeat protein (TIGR01451 family) [Saprospiraceae bacterium]|jgi:uncharacterized repeat protein (TIGR01451 family)